MESRPTTLFEPEYELIAGIGRGGIGDNVDTRSLKELDEVCHSGRQTR